MHACISRSSPRLQAIAADLGDQQVAAAGTKGGATDAAGAGGAEAGSRGPLVLPMQLRASMQSLRDAAAAELAQAPPDAGQADGASDMETDAETDADAGDSEMPMDPDGWDPSEWAEDSGDLWIASRAIRDGVDMADLWRLPGMLDPPDVPVEQWPRLMRALDVLCSNVLQQVDVRTRPPLLSPAALPSCSFFYESLTQRYSPFFPATPPILGCPACL